MTPFAAVLLAGGQSRRMGRDKALLPLSDGRLLWERQLGVLRELEPAALFVSGPERAGFPKDVRCLPDALPNRGPLAGIAAALEAAQAPLLVVLAIDLPRMTTGFLRRLLQTTDRERGVVPRQAQQHGGFYEPLAAVYPRRCLPLALTWLNGNDYSLQGFVRGALEAGCLQEYPLNDADDPALFANWNAPHDLGRSTDD